MRIRTTRLGVALIAAAALTAMTFAFLDERAAQPRTAVPAPDTTAAPAAAPAEARAETPSAAAAAFTHYRIGDAAARTLYGDGPLIWVGTSVGVVRYDTRSGERRVYDKRDGLPSTAILFVGKMGGKLIFGTNGGGLAVFDPADGAWENYGVADGLPDARVFAAHQASNGDLWIATWGGVTRVRAGLLRSRGEWRQYTAANTNGGLAGDRTYAVAEDRAGAMWFASQGGVARYQRDRWTNWKDTGGPAAADAVSLAVTADGIVWVGTLGAGLGAFDGRRWRAYTTADGLPGARILALHADAARSLWIGTDRGLARFSDRRFSSLGTADGLLGNTVFAVAAPADGTLWIGGNGGVAHIRRYTLHDAL